MDMDFSKRGGKYLTDVFRCEIVHISDLSEGKSVTIVHPNHLGASGREDGKQFVGEEKSVLTIRAGHRSVWR